MVENRLVGIKSRGIYETPGGTILYFAHRELEEITLDAMTRHYKEHIAIDFAELIYNGLWFSPLKDAFLSFIDKTQENVSGDIKLKLYKGNIFTVKRTSPCSLYSMEYATFEKDKVYSQKDAEGFIKLYGLQLKIFNQLKRRKK